MKKIFLVFLVFTLSMTNFTEPGFAKSPDLSIPVSMSPNKSKIELFNGKNLDGWYTFLKGKGRNIDPNKVFTVQKGQIRISRVNKARDSGVLLHSTGNDGEFSGTWMHSIEILIYLNGTLVNHAVDVHPAKGRIQIQSESAEILIRRVELTLL